MFQCRVERFATLIERAVADEKIPCADWVIGIGGRILGRAAIGCAHRTPKREALRAGMKFDLASLSKLIGVWPAALRAIQSGRLAFGQTLGEILPLPMHSGVARATVYQLLTHTAGLIPSAHPTGATRAEMLLSLLALPPACEPGARVLYSDLSFLFLGEALSCAEGKPLNEIASDVWRTLGMRDTCYCPKNPAECVPTEWKSDTQMPIRGVVHDECARALGGIAGHAGVFSTSADLARFMSALAPGRFPAVLPEALVKKSFENQTTKLESDRGLGWVVYRDRPDCRLVGHTGFTGTSLWLDAVSGLYAVLLTNRVHPSRENDAMRGIRAEGMRTLYGP